MSEVGRLSAALTLDGAQEFQSKLESVGRTFMDSASKGSAFGRAGEAAFRTAAGATTALTTAGAAYLTILTKTGVAYNSLQQNSRAALSVMLGGAEGANAQMDKLDAFARNSPFSKSLFIDAQQQMLGFGIESQKVIPYLDAIQNAVAATGGNSNKIAELSTIMSQIQSSAKITAGDLREFGNRGVDAAQLIGSQMGKTAAEIRDEISSGAIDATTALDALAAGMEATFGGTTDLVKEQWTGAVDRVKAANRDIGAIIAEPFVSKNGGGMAVDWGNQVADVLRAIERQAQPVMDIFTSRGAGMFAGIYEGLDRAQQSISRFDPASLEVGLDKLSGHAPAIAALTGGLLALGGQVGPLGRMFGTLGLTVNPVVAALVGLAAASPELRSALVDVLAAGKPLLPLFGELAQVASGALTTALPVVADGISLIASVAAPLVDIISQIPAPLLLGAAAFVAMHRATGALAPTISAVAASLRGLAERGAVQAALGGTSQEMGVLSAASMTARSGVRGLGDALKTAFLSNPIGIALTVISAAVGAWAAANASAQQKVEEHKARVAELRGTLDETTASLTNSSRAMVAESAASEEMASKLKAAGVSGQAYTAALIDGGGAARMFEHDVLKSALAAVEAGDKTKQLSGYAETLGVSYNDLIRSGLGYEDAQSKINASMRESGADSEAMSNAWTVAQGIMNGTLGTQRDVVSSYDAMSASISAAVEEQHRINAAVDGARGAMSDIGRATQDYNSATATAADSTESLETRVRALKAAYDILTGGASSAAEAAAAVDAANLSLAEGFTKADDNGVSFWASAINLAEEATNYVDTSTRYGQELFSALQAQQDATLQASIVARDTAINNGESASDAFDAARSAAEEYNAGLSQSLTEAGIVGDAHAALMEAWSIQPDVAAFTVTDNGTMDAATLQALQLAIDVQGIPDKTITIDEPLSPEVIRRLTELGHKVETLPNGNIVVTQSGVESVNRLIDNAARDRYSTISVQQILYKSEVLGPVKNDFAGGMYGAGGKHFAGGGNAFASGIYRGVVGGIPKMGADGQRHIFAEKELGVPWETYISGSPAYRDRNIALLLETARRLRFPVIPVSSLGGVQRTRNYASGGSAGPTPVVPMQGLSGGRSGPVIGTVVLGENTSTDSLTELQNRMDFYERGRRV